MSNYFEDKKDETGVMYLDHNDTKVKTLNEKGERTSWVQATPMAKLAVRLKLYVCQVGFSSDPQFADRKVVSEGMLIATTSETEVMMSDPEMVDSLIFQLQQAKEYVWGKQ